MSPMFDDPYPLPTGSRGIVTQVTDVDLGGGDAFVQVHVKWDCGRAIMVVIPPDDVRVIEGGGR